MSDNKEVTTIMRGALILSLSSLIAKILSAFYRIPFENLVGNIGFYVYQQVYPLYGIGMTFALSGLPVFISKVTVEAHDERAQWRTAQQLLVLLSGGSLLIFGGLMGLAPTLALHMGDRQLTVIIRSVAWMILLMPILAVGRGFYQGKLNMVPTAISQVSEQVVRVGVIVGVAYYSVQHHWSVYRMGAGAMLGATIGAIVASLVFLPLGPKISKKVKKQQCFSYRILTKRLLTEGLVICLFAALMLILQLVDSFTVKQALVANGMPDLVAKAVKGNYDRAQPLVQVGTVLAVSFSATLLPSLSKALAKRDMEAFRAVSQSLIRISVTVGVAATVGLITLMPAINTVLFKDAVLSTTLAIYCLSIVLVTLITNYNALLQSIDRVQVTVVSFLAGVMVKLLTNTILIRWLGISGASWGTVLALTVTLVIMLLQLPPLVQHLLYDYRFWKKLCLAVGIMAGVTVSLMVVVQHYLQLTRLVAIGTTASGVILGGLIFIGLSLETGLLTQAEWQSLPGGTRLWTLWHNIRKKRSEQ
ncbi:polysaccharide biosynthesis protein [Ligilactobacillus saerimneri]|uniref:putative polysaccharide biosynthesis protein n=1 Tax=Ligilactobacillus saerimneri TaxID=228229 RepID=UPI0030CE1DE0